ncbi:MAG: lysophospholipid acyltransferase family protein [Verrucomicrobiota bacterium]|nr:lysophospholipid acyltransferase family protein [Verrucomicrobiota bacterium]
MLSSGAIRSGLKWYQRSLLLVMLSLMLLWGRTLRFHFGADLKTRFVNAPHPVVIILWHNRLFAASIFFRRYLGKRRVAALISTSQDGAWLAEIVKCLGIFPIRGSRHKRGSQALRELIAKQRQGFDVAVTPDGSRGPLYDMKPGAVKVAMNTGSPIVLLSFNYSKAWRLKSWDKFYLPYPFSRIDVCIDYLAKGIDADSCSYKAAASLKERMDTVTID